MKLNENSPIPLYYQLENIIREKIEQGDYEEGDKIPSERKLSDQFNLSRMTIRKAIENLVDEGLLHRKRGKGTFVSQEKLDPISGLIGHVESMKIRGIDCISKVVNQELLIPRKEIGNRLELSEDEKVILTERLRLARGKIIGFERSYVPYSVCPTLLEVDLAEASIYKCLIEAGYNPTKARDEVEAILADDKLSDLLKIENSCAVLRKKRVTFSNNKPIEFSYNYYRGDKMSGCYTVTN
ncbi:phosphonate metabolism transcriptional regulator PhnF [Halanaerobaculum tunisiense]